MASNSGEGNGSDKVSSSHGDIVAEHYNKLDEKGLAERTNSRIFYLRNFNNWIKSMLIGEYLQKVKKQNETNGKEICVLDLACGKGGDLLKWKKGEIDHLVCADIAATSVEQCANRYKEMWERNQFDRRPQKKFTAEFITADCTKARLKDLYKRNDVSFDLISCQFSFHYCFESLPQAEQMLQNISECLRPGGYFIGTTTDASQLVSRLKECTGLSFGNDVYSVKFSNRKSFPLFGAKYDFHLEGVVDCPEFLVYFPLLKKLAEKYGMRLDCRKRFDEFYQEMLCKEASLRLNLENGRQLLGRMQALESFPPFEEVELMGNHDTDYNHAKERVSELERNSERRERVGTLSLSEWEAISMYIVFAFEKCEEPVKKRKLPDDFEEVDDEKEEGEAEDDDVEDSKVEEEEEGQVEQSEAEEEEEESVKANGIPN